jgi:predicted PurR-regulated permease PerM
MSQPTPDLARVTLGVAFIGGLTLASLWLLGPFLPAIVWSVTLVVATWPLMLDVQRLLGNRRGPAVAVMTVLMLLILVLPLWLAISTIVTHADQIGELAQTILSFQVPAPPDWVARIPLVGGRIVEIWSQFTEMGVHELGPKLTPYAGLLTHWFVLAVGGLGGVLLQFLLIVVIAAGMYANGEALAAKVLGFGHRLGGDRGRAAVRLAGGAIRGVALGVVVTSLAQSIVGGIGLALVGIPFAAVLTAVMFFLCLAQLGPGFVLIPAVIWMFYKANDSAGTVWAVVFLIIAFITIIMDNFLRPILIRRGANLPLAVILAGVIGGLIAMGLLGIFLGPTVLAVGYTLLNAWIGEDEVVPAE